VTRLLISSNPITTIFGVVAQRLEDCRPDGTSDREQATVNGESTDHRGRALKQNEHTHSLLWPSHGKLLAGLRDREVNLMKTIRPLRYLCCLATLGALTVAPEAFQEEGATVSTPSGSAVFAQGSDIKLVYADFENVKDKRAFSNQGGYVQLLANSERKTLPSRFKGQGESNAPELVRLKPDDPNRAIAFDYEMQALNGWASVSLEVQGHEGKDGKPVADDVSAYKFLTMQIYVTGVSWMRVEFISKGQGLDFGYAHHKMEFKVSSGFNTYRIPLDKLTQPSWAEQRGKAKDALKKLTAVTLSVYCDQCMTTKGTVVVDNMTFQN
jgi:hypothetical protein